MGKIQVVKPVKLICGLISNDEALFFDVKDRLQRKFGRLDFESELIDFNFTDYYRDELGENLKRSFVSFTKLVDPDRLKEIKLFSNKIEDSFKIAGKRMINIDPGYVDLAKLVLASTKDFSHRIYLGKGIYAEVTLIYKHNNYCCLDWTYPDYRSKVYIETFKHIRGTYKGQIEGL